MCNKCKSIGKISKSMKHKKRHHRRHISGFDSKGLSTSIMTGAEVAVGIVVGKLVSAQVIGKIDFLNQTPFVGSVLRIVSGALLTSSMKTSFAKAAGLGIVADGILNLVVADLKIKVPGIAGPIYQGVAGPIYQGVAGTHANPTLQIHY